MFSKTVLTTKVIRLRVFRLSMVLSLALVLLAPQISYSQAVEENPTAWAMAGDLLIARPLLLGSTLIGVSLFLVSLPFTLAGGNTLEAGSTLVTGPALSTFVRCLGCTRPGYKKQVITFDEASE